MSNILSMHWAVKVLALEAVIMLIVLIWVGLNWWKVRKSTVPVELTAITKDISDEVMKQVWTVVRCRQEFDKSVTASEYLRSGKTMDLAVVRLSKMLTGDTKTIKKHKDNVVTINFPKSNENNEGK